MEKREVYFDNSATTRAFDEVRDIVAETMTVDYGNTSSRHMKGVEAENYIKTAREEIAKTLKVKDKEILYLRRNRIQQSGADRNGACK